MSGAAEEAYGIAMSNTAVLEQSSPITVDNALSDHQWLVQLLIDAGLKGERSEFDRLAQRFYQQPNTLRLVAAYLKRWYAGRLNGLETISGFAACKSEDALGLVLSAFENKLQGASDLTLLYLLSLSDRPVPQQNMKDVFRSTFMERWLTRRDDYVRFLGPLGRLNTEHWHWVVENLRRLQLLEQPIPGQHDLLFVEEPIRQYFRSKLLARSNNTYEQAMEDMEKLFQETVVEFRQRYRSTPEIKTFISPELKAELEEPTPEVFDALWKTRELDEVQKQLLALRESLDSLKIHTKELAIQLEQDKAAESNLTEVQAIPDSAKGSRKSGTTMGVLQKLTLPPMVRRAQKKSRNYAAKIALPKLTLPPTAINHQPEATTAGQDTA